MRSRGRAITANTSRNTPWSTTTSGTSPFVFSNVIVHRSSGPTSTSEIDVVMLHEKGVFVIESKNYSGWIFGSTDQRNWTVTLNANYKEHFYNPIKQNRAHVKASSHYLGLEEEAFSSYIVFSERCELKKVPPNTDEYAICRRHHLLSNIRRNLNRFDPLFDEATFEELRVSLAALAEGSTQTVRTQHVEKPGKSHPEQSAPAADRRLSEEAENTTRSWAAAPTRSAATRKSYSSPTEEMLENEGLASELLRRQGIRLLHPQ